jgi:hypothetical protein
MRWYSKVIIGGIFLISLPAGLLAQTNICQASSPTVPAESRAELARVQAEERSRQEMARANWTATILPVTNLFTANSFQALCIFGIEVSPQPAQRVIAIRAPKELMPAIAEAFKRLDVPAPPLPVMKSVELTAYVLVMADVAEPGLMPIPAELQAVANQLKSVLPAGTVYLADTVVARGIDRQFVRVNGGTSLGATVNVREGTPPVVRLDNLAVQTNSADFQTNIDIPVGIQVVVGKATSREKKKPVVLVITAKLLN